MSYNLPDGTSYSDLEREFPCEKTLHDQICPNCGHRNDEVDGYTEDIGHGKGWAEWRNHFTCEKCDEDVSTTSDWIDEPDPLDHWH